MNAYQLLRNMVEKDYPEIPLEDLTPSQVVKIVNTVKENKEVKTFIISYKNYRGIRKTFWITNW